MIFITQVRTLLALVILVVAPLVGYASGHREAPITALDHPADITDVYAFVSYSSDQTPKVTLIMCVDPFLEPANGPHWFPFDPQIAYQIKIDNNNDARADIVFTFRFTTEQNLPKYFQAYKGVPGGARAPANSPPPVAPGALVIPGQIRAFNGLGLGLKQKYTVTMVKNGASTQIKLPNNAPFFAVPANVGPRTMDYNALFNAGTYTLSSGIRVFAGTTDDPFWGDLGGFADTLNLHKSPPVLSAAEDAANQNFVSDTYSGYAVNAIAIEVPIAQLTRTGNIEPSSSPAATIGVWATTSRPEQTTRRSPLPSVSSGPFKQVQRMGHPFINHWLIDNSAKDRFSMDIPLKDNQFSDFLFDPVLARVVNALTDGAVAIPTPPRNDLRPLFQYLPPVAASGTTAGPLSDMLRLNTGVPATQPASAHRLGLLGGDPAGYPNGRRVFDDVTDIMLRLVVGGVLAAPFEGYNSGIGGRLGDGVNVNDTSYRNAFPYLGNAPSGRDRRHIDPGEPGCTAGAGAACP
jgi:hypothetical protein